MALVKKSKIFKTERPTGRLISFDSFVENELRVVDYLRLRGVLIFTGSKLVNANLVWMISDGSHDLCIDFIVYHFALYDSQQRQQQIMWQGDFIIVQ